MLEHVLHWQRTRVSLILLKANGLKYSALVIKLAVLIQPTAQVTSVYPEPHISHIVTDFVPSRLLIRELPHSFLAVVDPFSLKYVTVCECIDSFPVSVTTLELPGVGVLGITSPGTLATTVEVVVESAIIDV